MNYYEFYAEQESKISKMVLGLNFIQKLMFCYYCMQRNVGNYYHFSIEENLSNPNFLKDFSNNVWNLVTSKTLSSPKAETLMSLLMADSNLPHIEESSNAMWAIDACGITYRVLEYYNTKKESHLTYISLLSIEAVEKWIYEKNGHIEELDPHFSDKLLSNLLMQNEIKDQDRIIDIIRQEQASDQLFSLIEAEVRGLERTNIGYPIV